jgi:hypothetical protein
MAEEYCWAVTQETWRSCCCRSGSSVLDFGFQLDFLLRTYAYTWPFVYLGPIRAIFDSRRTLRKVTTVHFGGVGVHTLQKSCLSAFYGIQPKSRYDIWIRTRARAHAHTDTHNSPLYAILTYLLHGAEPCLRS